MTLPPFPTKLLPEWPPAWNPFHVFILALSLISSIGLLQGSTGSQVLDARLSVVDVAGWGFCLAAGSAVALAGVYFYRTRRRLMLGLYLERTGLILVGGAAAIYTYVVLHAASDLSDARYACAINLAYAAACFVRVWQDHKAIRWARSNTPRG